MNKTNKQKKNQPREGEVEKVINSANRITVQKQQRGGQKRVESTGARTTGVQGRDLVRETEAEVQNKAEHRQ